MRVRRKRFKKYTMVLLSEFLMRRVGIEPTTFGLEDQCSIRLSYRPKLISVYYKTANCQIKPVIQFIQRMRKPGVTSSLAD